MVSANSHIRRGFLVPTLFVALVIGVLFALTNADVQRTDAATGVIDALNVGTCLATDDRVFEDETCALYSDGSNAWRIRDEVEEVRTLYATYAFDPKTGWSAPRAILQDTDLIKISIHDPDRDKRSGVLVRGEGQTEITGDLAEITRLLRNNGVIANDEIIAFESGTELTVRDGGGIARIDNSGSNTINFTGASTYKPMAVDGNIRFFGCVTEFTVCVLTGSGTDKLVDITSFLDVDEDRTSGSINPSVAPWLAVNASVPADKDIEIHAIFYETSGQETMVGGQTYHYCGASTQINNDNGVWKCNGSTASARDSQSDIQFTSDEIRYNEPLTVRATSNGNRGHVNLYLQETDLFTGRYEGYVRLTDPNGDGRVRDGDTSVTDWGQQLRDATSHTISGAAVIGVTTGPVYIEYEDSSGRSRSLTIEIDLQPPTIYIDSPQHQSASDDHSPDFIGTFEDYQSGLARDSFRLVVDNDPDNSSNYDFALDNLVPRINVRGSKTNGSVYSQNDYIGFSTSGNDSFGVVMPSRLYNLGDDSCDRGQNVCFIEADNYSDGDTTARFDDRVRLRLDSDSLEFGIDFQAFVVDVAGNIGFSDSDPDRPYFINDLGQEDPKDRVPGNVLGALSAHIIGLDEKDPEISTTRSATGYYGLDIDDKPIVDRHGVMLVFDGPIAESSISTTTFYVELDDGSEGEVIDFVVDEQYVFLKLADELASDATPYIGINPGERVRDRAGNITSGRELKKFEANDGISPKLTVTLSGGSGIGTGNEGPDRLTNNIIQIHIASDEAIHGAPLLFVVCNDLQWEQTVNARKSDFDIDDFINNRIGAFNGKPREPSGTDYQCGSGDDAYNFTPREMQGNARPGENWEVGWQNAKSGSSALKDGRLRVVAYARDRSKHVRNGQFVQSWGAGATDLTLDTELLSPVKPSGGRVFPADGEETSELRPFILLEFNEPTPVTIESAKVDGLEQKGGFRTSDHNRFVYWPQSMSRGKHEVEVKATDAAGNSVEFDFEFTSTERGDFVINIVPGWNAISVPADPIDSNIDTVFSDPAITAVIGWDIDGWRIAVRRSGVWESNAQYAPLTSIRSRYGYWVKSDAFIYQRVPLIGIVRRSDVPALIDIPTQKGWNFVGVVDHDGDQTEDHFGETLIDSQDEPVSAADYLGTNYVRAYTWDATFRRFTVLRETDAITIGHGIWVYYPDGTGIAP